MSQPETAQVKLPEQRPAGPGEGVVPVAGTPEGVEDAMGIPYDPNAAENAAYEAGREARAAVYEEHHPNAISNPRVAEAMAYASDAEETAAAKLRNEDPDKYMQGVDTWRNRIVKVRDGLLATRAAEKAVREILKLQRKADAKAAKAQAAEEKTIRREEEAARKAREAEEARLAKERERAERIAAAERLRAEQEAARQARLAATASGVRAMLQSTKR